MKEPTGETEAEIQSLQRQINRLNQDNQEYRLELELANQTIIYLESLIEQYKYQAFVNDKNKDDWK